MGTSHMLVYSVVHRAVEVESPIRGNLIPSNNDAKIVMIHEESFIFFNNLMSFNGENAWNEWKLQNIRFCGGGGPWVSKHM